MQAVLELDSETAGDMLTAPKTKLHTGQGRTHSY